MTTTNFFRIFFSILTYIIDVQEISEQPIILTVSHPIYSHQDWAKMGEDGYKISMYKNVFLAPEGHIKAISSKPKPRMINNSAKMDSGNPSK